MTGPIRVLVIGPRYPSHNSRGGMATVVGLMRAQRDPRVRLTTVTTYVDDTAAVRLRTGALGVVRAVLLIVAGRVDVVHVHLAHRGSVLRKSLPLLVAQARGVPTVIHAHSYDFASWFDALRPRVQALVRRALPANRWLVLGEGLVKPYQDRFKLPAGSIRVLLNPAPPVRPARSARSLAVAGSTAAAATATAANDGDGDGDVVVAVGLGRMGHRKGTYDLLEALDRLGAPARTALHVVLAGDGEVDTVREEITRRGLGDLIEARSWLEAPERDALLGRADVFLLPSHAEGLPMAMLEAMSAGLVPVVSAVGAVGEIAHDDRNAVLVAPGDPAALASAIEGVVLDPERRHRLAAGARASAADLGVTGWFDDLVQTWTQVFDEGSLRRRTSPR